jgi:hypothetical protein
MTSLTRPPRPTAAEIARDPAAMGRWMEEIDMYYTLKALEKAIAARTLRHAAAAVRARFQEPNCYPRLHLAGGQRAGRVGAARFKGRYHPHLI